MELLTKLKHIIMNTTMNRIEADQQALAVRKTTNYDQFKRMPGNREINKVHLNRLIKSFSKNHFISPIIVNEHKQVIDGEHRLLASKKTGRPVYYITIPGYGTDAMQVLNTNTSVWNKNDYLNHYCEMGVQPYLDMRDFMEDFPDFSLGAVEALLSDRAGGHGSAKEDSRKHFQEGRFKIKNIIEATENARKIQQFKRYYVGYNRTVFVRAMITMFKTSNYNHGEMISKLSLSPTKMVDCTCVNQYKLLLEDIYNFRRRNKVNLRYATT